MRLDGATSGGNLAPLMSSANPNWETPEGFLEIVRRLGPIGFDPCTTPENPVGAYGHIAPPDDGLALPWDSFPAAGLVFVNPPYGRGLGAWSAKMKEEARRGAEIVGLLPARTDTKWWQDVTTADAVCFLRGRLRFKGAPSAAPFPSAVPYWGPRSHEFRRVFQQYGWVVFSRQQSLLP